MTDPIAEGRKAGRFAGVVIRSIRPDDATGLQTFHAHLSDDTIRNRFLGAHPVLTDAEAHQLTSFALGAEVAFVATADEVIVAVGRYVRLGGGDAAEVAFVVADLHQGHGIGTALLTLLARVAWDDGIRRFEADTFAVNAAMLHVFMHTPRAVAVESARQDGPVDHLVMGVVPPESLLFATRRHRGMEAVHGARGGGEPGTALEGYGSSKRCSRAARCGGISPGYPPALKSSRSTPGRSPQP